MKRITLTPDGGASLLMLLVYLLLILFLQVYNK